MGGPSSKGREKAKPLSQAHTRGTLKAVAEQQAKNLPYE